MGSFQRTTKEEARLVDGRRPYDNEFRRTVGFGSAPDNRGR